MIDRWKSAKVYTIEAGTEIPYEAMRKFYDETDNEIDVIRLVFSDGRAWYANKGDVKNHTVGADCFVPMEGNFFHEAYQNPHIMGGGVPIVNDIGDPVYVVRWRKRLYEHSYLSDPSLIDVSILERWDGLVMYELTEYAYLILSECIPKYSGDVILIGESWTEFLAKYPADSWGRRAGQVRFARTPEELANMTDGKNMARVGWWSSPTPWTDRFKCPREGRFLYGDLMLFLYFFADRHGKVFSQKVSTSRPRFIVIDSWGRAITGIGSVACYFLSTMYTYAASRGFIPVFNVIASSHESPYIDDDEEELWGKFFDQPSGYTVDDIDWDNDDVRFMPRLDAMPGGPIEMMKQIAPCSPLNLSRYLNRRCREYVAKVREMVFGDKKNILGLFIRGAEYTKIKPEGADIQATPEQVITKAAELGSDRFSYIYACTEDTEVLELLKGEYGDRLLCTERTYFDFRKVNLCEEGIDKYNKEYSLDGWTRGIEYIASLELLTECDGMVASGHTMGIEYVERTEGAQRFCPNFCFELGVYTEGTRRYVEEEKRFMKTTRAF